MEQNTRAFVEEETKKLIAAPSVCDEAKEAAEKWLSAAGTAAEAEETKRYIKELEEDIIPIDGLISFAESPEGAAVFGGAEGAKEAAAHGRAIKAKGAKYCDCPACSACEAILSRKAEILA